MDFDAWRHGDFIFPHYYGVKVPCCWSSLHRAHKSAIQSSIFEGLQSEEQAMPFKCCDSEHLPDASAPKLMTSLKTKEVQSSGC